MQQALLVDEDVAAIEVSFAFDPAKVAFRGLSEIGAGVTSASYVAPDGKSATVHVFSETPLNGSVLKLHWIVAEGATGPPLAQAAAYRSDGSAANGSVALGPLDEDTTTDLVTSSLNLSSFSAGDQARLACLASTYDAGVADYPMGDLDRSGGADIRDVVLAHARIATASIDLADPFELFHLDLTGDCAYDQSDVERLFMKASDPSLAAAPVMKPGKLTYSDLVNDKVVLVGNAGNVGLEDIAFEGVNLNGSPLSSDFDWGVEGQTGVWRVVGNPNDAIGSLHVSAGEASADVLVGNIAILVAGQSNAVGWDPFVPLSLRSGTPGVNMLGNDYVWKPATEPLDVATGQVDCVSIDTGAGTSAGTTLGRALRNGSGSVTGTGRDIYLIPSALGGTRVSPHIRDDNCVYPDYVGWNLNSVYPGALAGMDRDTLFGSAVFRALVSAGVEENPVSAADPPGGPVSAVFWYQGESDNTSSDLRGLYSPRTEDVFEAFRDHLSSASAAVDPVIIYAQLAAYGCCRNEPDDGTIEDLRSHDIAERQRRLEGDSYAGTPAVDPNTGLSAGVAFAHMVVTHDLPRFDRIHLSAQGQMILAERVALAYQEHVLGWDVDGTGPRISGLSRSGDTIRLTLDRDVTQTSNPGPDGYSGYFTVYWGAPTGSNYAEYGGNELEVFDVYRDPNDPSRVLIEHEAPPGPGSIYLRYKRPHESSDTSNYLNDVIRGVDSGLPLPSFGPLRVDPQ